MGWLADWWSSLFTKPDPPVNDATVFMLAGTGGDPKAVKGYMNGEVALPHRTLVPVYYPNRKADIDPDIREGARILNEQLIALPPGRKRIVLAHSLGAVVCSAWLKHYGPDSLIDPADLSFILMGNSVRPHGGYYPAHNFIQTNGEPFVSRDIVEPIVGTRYQVTDYALQYDGWCDWPAEQVKTATDYATYGGLIYHLMYSRFPLERDDYRHYVDPVSNITYTHIPIKVSLSASRRAAIEAAYSRPEG